MNRNVHTPAGVVSAAVHVMVEDDPTALPPAELGGRLVGGAWGSRLPDIIDPPTHPATEALGTPWFRWRSPPC